MTTPAAESVDTPDIAQCVRDVAGLLRASDRSELATRVEEHHSRPANERPNVVVVGETKRGKSSLVNALLGHPNLSPVDPDIATCVHLTFTYSQTEWARVTVAGQAEPVEIELSELAAWASEGLNRGNERNASAIEVGLPAEILRHITLVDTPGVGGLEMGHAELTLQALGGADAILFVVDADNAINDTELRFLERASERVDTVALVLTKVDQHPGWRTIQSDNQALLAKRAPRFRNAPILPVSSLNAERALSLRSPELIRAEREKAGLTRLETLLVKYVAARAHQLHDANTLRFCMRAVAEVRGIAVEEVKIASGDNALAKDLADEQARLGEMSTNGVDMRRDIEAQLAKLSLAREARLREKLEELQKQYSEAAKEHRGQEELQRLSGQFVAALDAALRELAEQTGQQMLQAIQVVIGHLADDTEFAESVRLLGTVTDSPDVEYDSAGQKKLTSLEMFTAVTPVLSIDRLVTFLPSVLGAPALAAGPIGLVAAGIGAAVAMVLARERKKIAAQNSFTQWVVAVINGARNEDRVAFGTAMVDARTHIAKALDDAIKRRSAEIAGERARLEKALSESEAERARARQAATSKVTAIDTLAKRLGETYRAVNDQRARTAEPASAGAS